MSNLQIYRGIEEVITPEIIKDPLLEEVIKHLNEFDFTNNLSDEKREKLFAFIPLLNQLQILSISKYLKNKPTTDNFELKYLSKIINESYSKGFNSFTLETNYKNYFVRELEGQYDNFMQINVLSYVENFLGLKSKKCKLTTEYNVEMTGFNMSNCFTEIKGNLDYLAPANSNCKFIIHGELLEAGEHKLAENSIVRLNSKNFTKWKNKLKRIGYKVEVLEE